jgi:FK506-binding nuclear protein
MATPPVYGLEIPPGEQLISGSDLLPLGFHITMAAIDPSETPLPDAQGKVPPVSRATLRIIRPTLDDMEDDEDDSDDDEDVAELRALLAEAGEDDSDDESNGGPSDLNKAKKQKAQAALKKLLESTQDEDSDDDSDEDEVMQGAKQNGKAKSKANGAQSSKKGKEKAMEIDQDEDSDEDQNSDSSLDDEPELEQFVICTLDSEKTYQQPLNLTIGADEKVFFSVSGNHTVYLTGNYIVPHEHDEDSEDEDYGEDGYDLDPNEMEGDEDSSDESDELDGLEDPRIIELESGDEEEQAPKLVDTKGKKGKKRPAEDDLDELIAKETKTAEPKLSKKQQKKLKNNQGEAVSAEGKQAPQTPKDSVKSDKKVQFAKQLEQGPTGSAEKAKQAPADKPKHVPSVKERDGVTIDDRTMGNGRVVKPGDKVSVRYIGRLASNGSVFDANKKGKPFSFTVGKGEVIKGWDSGLVGMAPGGERRLTIPPKMAYGSRRMGEIPANSTLKFDIKLLEIK